MPEITHSSPKPADVWNVVTFSFQWTAPAAFTSATLTAWGNAVNLSHSPSGDAASSDTLEIFSSTADTPTPTATPSPTPTIAGACNDLAPLKPYLIADPDQRKCQETISKAAAVLIKKDLKAVQKCLKAFQKGPLTGDPATLCAGDAATLPTDTLTNAKVAGAQAKFSALLDAKCTDAEVAPLRLCADTVSGLETCLLSAYRQRIVDITGSEYGALVQTDDSGVRSCQNAIASAGRKYVSAAVKAGQKCLNARNKECLTGDAAALCLGALVGGSDVAPTDADAAAKLAQAEAKLRAKIIGKCTDAQVAVLDSCGSDQASAADCIACSHRGAFYGIVSDGYGGADVFANPAITLQAAVDAADPGDTIMLDPGNYPEAVAITTDGLQLVGQKSCLGGRAVLTNPGSAANGIFASGVDGLLFEGFQADNYDDNDIFVSGAEGVTFRDMVTNGPGTSVGTKYGLFRFSATTS